MAKLTYIYRSDESNCVKVSKRQLPLLGGENLMMLMDLSSKGLVFDRPSVKGAELEEFTRKYQLLSPAELRLSLHVPTVEFTAVLSQNVPCVGCRRSVERLFYQLMLSGHPTLDPIVISSKGVLTISDDKIRSAQAVCNLLHKHKSLLDGLLDNQFRNRKSSRCNLHSLDSFRSRPFSETWRDVWNCMKQQCKDELAVIEASELHSTLDGYLKKHKFCQECRTKVEKAYSLLVDESNPAKEKGYVAHLYSGIKRCLTDKHIHLQTKLEYIDGLIKRAEPELSGRNSRHRERHAKTLEIAQEEVLTCIGMCLYERLRRINVCLREEENACQVLAAVAVHALSRSFDMAVENKQGISNLELLYQEISREERSKEQKKEQKKLKKRKKRNEKKSHTGGPPSGTASQCQCDNDHDDEEEEEEEQVGTIDGGYSSEPQNTESSQLSSSSLVSTPEGSEVACSDGFCNHHSSSGSNDSGLLSSQKTSQTTPQSSSLSSTGGSPAPGTPSPPSHGSARGYTSCSAGPALSLLEMLDKSSTEEDDGEVDFIPHECILEFKARSNIIKQQREALRQQLLNNFKRLCINHCGGGSGKGGSAGKEQQLKEQQQPPSH